MILTGSVYFCFKGIIPQLHHRYDMGVSGTKAAWLALDTDHYASTVGDAGWGCGYRNLQMLISALLKMDTYRPVMYSGECIILKTFIFLQYDPHS